MYFLAAILVLSASTVFVHCDSSSDISDIIKNFELCDVKCNGKSCECCQKIKAPFNVEVCGSSSLRVAEKAIDLIMKVEGDIIAQTTAKLDRLLNFCIPVKTKGGNLAFCIITSIADNKSNPSAVDICMHVDVSIEGVNFVLATFNCAKFDGGIEIEGETSKGLKTFGSVKVTNGEQLARFVQRVVMGK
ncbi:uncharacterized protein [Halyomorpha halys]|uniref:uncharacterized protein isoform X2 n=1 Tax=Halyomorpha halys TaxID=286706 RepID=UPI0006D4EBEC|nr:uncharacterized protein LOC106685431 isoform X2 [Halyomorpha halys]